jgi:hypothetical protein
MSKTKRVKPTPNKPRSVTPKDLERAEDAAKRRASLPKKHDPADPKPRNIRELLGDIHKASNAIYEATRRAGGNWAILRPGSEAEVAVRKAMDKAG